MTSSVQILFQSLMQKHNEIMIYNMHRNNNRKEYIDIPINTQQTPLSLFQKFQTPALPTDTFELSLEFIEGIDKAIRSQDCPSQLLTLYFSHFPYISSHTFTDKNWPAVHQIQNQYQQKDFNAKVQTIYNQLRLRSKFQKLRKGSLHDFIDAAQQSWENYQSILERESKQINFPPLAVWDIIDNFINQFSQFQEYKAGLEEKDRKDISEDIFSAERTHKLLNNLAKYIPKQVSKAPTCRQTFGYFALLANATLQVHSCKYKQALSILSTLSLQHLQVYSKSIGALLNLFLISTYSYFMLQQYKEAARLSELALLFSQKNKKYYTSPIIQSQISPLIEKLATILCLSLIFLEQKPKPIINQLFKTVSVRKDKIGAREKLSDIYHKLKQNNLNTFNKVIQGLSLPSLHPDDKNISELVGRRFQQLQNITLNSILQHYTQITVSKMSKMLKISQAEAMNQIESFNNISTGSAPWDRTIMSPLLSHTHKLNVDVSNGVVNLDTKESNQNQFQFQWQQYHEEIGWLTEKVDAL